MRISFKAIGSSARRNCRARARARRLVAEPDTQKVRDLRLILDNENAQGIVLSRLVRRGLAA
jgi:hypothetical protein